MDDLQPIYHKSDLIIHDSREIIDQQAMWDAKYVLAYYVEKDFYLVEKGFNIPLTKKLSIDDVVELVGNSDAVSIDILEEVLGKKEFLELKDDKPHYFI